MEEGAFLIDLLLLFGTALGALLIMRLVRGPVIIGYLIAGAIAGPILGHGEHIHTLAELGVTLLLFSIGLEVSPSKLWALRREALIGGTFQVLLTTGIVFGVASGFGVPLPAALVLGMAFSLSSTALILRLLAQKGLMDTPYGRISLAVLLLQDMVVIPMTILIPLLAGVESNSHDSGWMFLLKAVAVFGGVILLSRKLVPWLLDKLATSGTREGFLLGVSGIVFGTAWLTTSIGLSPALGAFLAGLLISESEHRVNALAEVAPFRDLFLAVFFVSVGMYIDPRVLFASPVIPLAIAAGIYLLKSGIVFGLVRLLRYPVLPAVRSGAYLGQVGEFSFVLLLLGTSLGVLSDMQMQTAVSSVALTLLFTPLAVSGAEAWAKKREKETGSKKSEHAPGGETVLIIGFGHGGRAVATSLKAAGIPYKIAEMNPETVKNWKQKGEPILRGDAATHEMLEALDAHHAGTAVIAINDPQSLRAVVIRLRQEVPGIFIIVRTRYATEMTELYDLGANEVVSEEFEASLHIVSLVLHHLGVPNDVVLRHMDELRGSCYRQLRSPSLQMGAIRSLKGLEVRPFTVEDTDRIAGRTILEMAVRTNTQATIAAIIRDSELLQDVANTRIQPQDTLILLGPPLVLDQAVTYLEKENLSFS